MGCSPLFLCLKNQRPMCGVIATMGASLYAIVWMIWGIVDIRFERNVTKVLYIIGFGLICLSFICFLALFVFLHFKNHSKLWFCSQVWKDCVLFVSYFFLYCICINFNFFHYDFKRLC